ncbi:MAG: Mur ligase family protein, partial [Clostridia bacterium]
MNYNDAMDYIHNSLKFGIKLGLDNMKTLMSLMGNPHKKLRYVHVAGTNGKGSTVAFINEILIKSGYKVGTYISPYIERFSERIKVNNVEIANDDIARITEFAKKNVGIMLAQGKGNPTEFEIVTAIAFQYFCEMNCDVVVLEVGLGGRFDSTNIIDSPMLSVITTISYDHTDILGNTLSEIAYEKAGIIKK